MHAITPPACPARKSFNVCSAVSIQRNPAGRGRVGYDRAPAMGEVLFVPASVGFEDFSEDCATWVFFYGPEGGEAE